MFFSESKASYLGTIPNYPCRLFPSPFNNTQSQLLRNFENIFEKKENTGKQHFLLLPQYFLLNERRNGFNMGQTCYLLTKIHAGSRKTSLLLHKLLPKLSEGRSHVSTILPFH